MISSTVIFVATVTRLTPSSIRQKIMAMIAKLEKNKRTEDEWVDSIRTEYEAAKKEAKFPSQREAILACLQLASSVRFSCCISCSISSDLLLYL